MATAPNKYLHDVAVQYQVYLERLKQHEIGAYDKTLAALDRALRSVINSATSGDVSSLTSKQFERLVTAAKKATAAHSDAFIQRLNGDLKSIASYSAKFEADTLKTALVAAASKRVRQASAAVAWRLAQEAPIQATGDLLQPFIEGWKATTLKRVEATLRNGRAQGLTADAIVRRLRGTKAAGYKDGVIAGQTRRALAAVVRTAVQHVATQGRAATWQENSDIVGKYRWVSTLDNRTTTVCRSLDGEEFELGKGPEPPIHVNCRSTTIPVIIGVDLLKSATRASKGVDPGQVPAKMTYYEWLKTQPDWFQDDALGKKRAELFRDGGLSADEFAALNLDKNFQPMTLDEMRQRAPKAFERAGL